jgi:hypothetical protein
LKVVGGRRLGLGGAHSEEGQDGKGHAADAA